MKRMSIVAAFGLALTFLIVADSQTRKPQQPANRPPAPENQTVDKEKLFRQTIATQSGGGVGGCDGKGTAPRCYTCSSTANCESVCVGYATCEIGNFGLFGHQYKGCVGQNACASGGPFGVSGGGGIAQ